MPHAKNLLLNGMDVRHRVPTDSLNLTIYCSSTVPPETRNEAKHNHIHERSFISRTALNFDRIFAEYAQPLKPEYLKGRWYAPEGIFLRLLQHFLHMLQFSSFIWPNSNLLKLLILVLQRAMRVQILHPSSLFHHMESIFNLLIRIFVK